MADSANTSTFTFGTNLQTDVRNITYSENGNPIDVTVLSDSNHVYEVGRKDVECTIETVGISTIGVGDTGLIAVAWGDSETDGLGTNLFVCVSAEASGSLDSELTANLTFKPSNP